MALELTVDQIREWITANKEGEDGKKLLSELNPPHELTAEEVRDFLDTQDGKTLVQPMVDSRVTEGIETYRKKHFEPEVSKRLAARLSEEMAKLNPTETPEQKRIRELEEKDRKRDEEWEKDKLKRAIVEVAGQMQLDAFFVDDFLPPTLEQGKLYLQKIAERDKRIAEKIRNETLVSGGFRPGSGSQGDKNKLDIEAYRKLPQEERLKLLESGKLPEILAASK